MEFSDAPIDWDRRRALNVELFRLSTREAPAQHA
jgi:hypothetical protein